MKHALILAAFVAALCTLPVANVSANPASPQATNGGGVNGTVDVKKKKGKKKIKPGDDCHDNEDVKVCNTGNSGNIVVDPEVGDADSDSNIKSGTGSSGTVTGLDAGDTVTVGSSSTMNVTGTGGSITMQGGSSGTITNLGGVGSTNMSVTLPSGSQVSVPPGSSVVITN